MAVVTTYSTATANAKATPRVQNKPGIERGRVHRSQGFMVVANGDSVGSVYPICRIRSCDYFDKLRYDGPDIGTTTAADFGLYDLASDNTLSTVVDADFFASAVVLNAGALSNTDLTFEAAAAGGLITNAEKRIWECLGLSSDPGKEYLVCATLTGAADAAGTGLVRVYVCNGD
jgi:hypothetical protein